MGQGRRRVERRLARLCVPGLVGYARLCPGDQYEVQPRSGRDQTSGLLTRPLGVGSCWQPGPQLGFCPRPDLVGREGPQAGGKGGG